MLMSYMGDCSVASLRLILCGCSGFIQKHCRIVYLSRTFIVDCLMASFKIICVDVSSDRLSRLFEIGIFRKIGFLILETTEPPFDHDVICPAALTIHALTDPVVTNEVNVFIAGELAALIRVIPYSA